MYQPEPDYKIIRLQPSKLVNSTKYAVITEIITNNYCGMSVLHQTVKLLIKTNK